MTRMVLSFASENTDVQDLQWIDRQLREALNLIAARDYRYHSMLTSHFVPGIRGLGYQSNWTQGRQQL